MLAAAIAVALATWGAPPCEVSAARVTPAALTAAAVASGLPEQDYAELAFVGTARCLILVDTTLPRRWRCSAFGHGWGHAMRYRHPVGVRLPDGTYDHNHSPNPRSVMHPTLEHIWRPCYPAPVPSGVRTTLRRMDSMIATAEHVKLGHANYEVVPQPLPLLKADLGPMLEQLGEQNLDTGNFADKATGGMHRLLKVFIPDLMPVYEWEGYATSAAMEAGELDRATATNLAPTAPQIKQALKVCCKVNGIDVWNTLGDLLDPTMLAKWADELKGLLIEQMRSRSTSSPSSSSEASDSASTKSSTTESPVAPATDLAAA